MARFSDVAKSALRAGIDQLMSTKRLEGGKLVFTLPITLRLSADSEETVAQAVDKARRGAEPFVRVVVPHVEDFLGIKVIDLEIGTATRIPEEES